jgi:hypothetical protein
MAIGGASGRKEREAALSVPLVLTYHRLHLAKRSS